MRLEIVIFKALGREEIAAIVKIQVSHQVKRLASKPLQRTRERGCPAPQS